MSAGPLVASAVGILILVVTAYVLVGGTLATTEVVVEAQSNLAMNQEARMRTAIEIQNTTIVDNRTLSVEVKNTGSEPIVDIPLIDVYLHIEDAPVYVPYGTGWSKENITPDDIHPGEFDPGETLTLSITHEKDANPAWVQVVTPNGVSCSAYTR
ncbi:flagellar protein FlaF [Methanoculleus sp. 7T]|uniref:flagellar protein FlaF n=1 Tax=Methanoculleus sp. 7T TaxID=2937282 RepID=UPI0020C00345|nr:flagellar protein FlaF [Methanoculleus sp. 7T]MCK8517517.1 flagellar protein FlaF [Methanoculleus sp. 7T]